jgi:hypothetical protein
VQLGGLPIAFTMLSCVASVVFSMLIAIMVMMPMELLGGTPPRAAGGDTAGPCAIRDAPPAHCQNADAGSSIETGVRRLSRVR